MPALVPDEASSPLMMGRKQAVGSIVLALIPMLYLFAVGCFLFVAPSPFLGRLFSCFHDNHDNSNNNETEGGYDHSYSATTAWSSSSSTPLDVRLARCVGCVLLGQILSCASLVYPIMEKTVQKPSSSLSAAVLVAGDPRDAATLDKYRSAVASLSIMGLLLLVAGLVDDRTTETTSSSSGNGSELWLGDDDDDDQHSSCSTLQSTIVIASGALTLVFACGSMMVSFWPASSSSMTNSATAALSRRSRVRPINTPDGDAQVPLLSASGLNGPDETEEVHPTEAAPTSHETTATVAPNNDPSMTTTTTTATRTEDSGDDDRSEHPTSRIRGTTRLLRLAAPQVFYLYVGCAVLLVRLPFSLSIPHFVSTTLGAVSRGDYAGARMEVILLFILGTIDAALDFWCVFLFGYANQRIVRGVRIDTFLSIIRQDVAFFDKTTSGELASRLNSDCGEMAGDLTWFFRFSIESVVRITGIVSYMLIRCPILGGCAITIIPIVALVNKFYGNWLNKNAREVQDALAAANQVAQETFSCIRTVIAFASEQQEYKKYKERIDHQYKLNVKQLYISGVYYMIISTFLINTVVQATLLFIGTSLIQHGKLTGEILLAFMLYQGQLQSETMNLFQSYTSLVKSSGAGDKVFSLLDRQPAPPGTGSTAVASSEIEDDEQAQERQRGSPGSDRGQTDSEAPNRPLLESSSSCSVELKNLHFTYPCRQDNKVLKDFNLQIPQGKTVALVGSSGCGKSTVVGLLQRFYDPSMGSILIDGKDLRTLDVKSHRRRIGVVTQNPTLFKGTIMSNITYGCPSASRADAIEAARLANALDFVNSFPDGFDTDVGERGVQLSGGQMQRITIARAIIKKPALLLLDEATSALDAASEQAVQDALDKLLKTNSHMTTVVVAHRLRTVRNADMIAFIENGQVAEMGKHEELLKLPTGLYRKMVEKAGNDGQLPDDF